METVLAIEYGFSNRSDSLSLSSSCCVDGRRADDRHDRRDRDGSERRDTPRRDGRGGEPEPAGHAVGDDGLGWPVPFQEPASGVLHDQGESVGERLAQKATSVPLDATATANLQLQLATTESVIVTGDAPLIDVTSTTTGSNYSARIIEKLPVGRNYAWMDLSQPGIESTTGNRKGGPSGRRNDE